MDNRDSSLDDSFNTKCVHTGQDTTTSTYQCYSVIPPIYLSTNYRYPEAGEPLGYEYSRDSNPNRIAFEAAVAKLEGGKFCNAFSSGTAAISALGHLIKPGKHVVCVADAYGGTCNFLRKFATRFGLQTTFVDTITLDNIKAAFRSDTELFWLESPTNPCLRITDIEAAVNIARNQEQKVLTVFDNTFATPYYQRPLQFGVDVVMHSVSKYINGHSDVIMGATITNNEAIYKTLKDVQIELGSVPSPFNCFLANRGLKTLALRMKQHQANGMGIAEYLAKSPYIEYVNYPGLPSHCNHDIAKKQMSGFSGMVSFSIKGSVEQAKAFLKNLKVIVVSVSLGGVETVAELTPVMTRAGTSQEVLSKIGISPTFIRLSSGIEDTQVLIDDIDQALNSAMS